MAEAVVLKNGRVVRTSSFDEGSMKFFNSGHLKSFEVSGERFTSVKGEITNLEYGYWHLDTMLKYRANLISKGDYLKGRFDTVKFIDAVPQNLEQNVEGDIILFERRRVVPDYQLICFVKFRVVYRQADFLTNYKNIPVTLEGAEMELPAICDRVPTGSTAHNFYVDYFGVPETRMPLELRANVAQLIQEMEDYIYRDFLSMHNAPRDLWTLIGEMAFTIVVTDFDNIAEFQKALNSFRLKELYANLLKFYTDFRVNRLIIEGSSDLKLRISTAFGMPFNVLVNIAPETKIEMLEYLVNNDYLSEWFERDVSEQFVIKILKSFTVDDLNAVNVFLNGLLKSMSDGDKNVTLFQRLYDSMSTDWALTEWTYNISNWAFNTDWKPEDTKGAFAKYTYYLWIVSEFNPYDYITAELKENSIGFFKKNNDTTNEYDTYNGGVAGGPVLDDDGNIVTTTIKDPNVKFYYTKYRGYIPSLLTEATRNIELTLSNIGENTREEAAPIHIYYESKKTAGVYVDNASFRFVGDSIRAFIDTKVHYNPHPSNDPMHERTRDLPLQYGRYKIFQPISLIDYSEEDTIIPIQTTNGETITYAGNINSLIPIFMLKYIDDAGDRADIQKVLGYIFELALTVTVIGNASKLYHLRHLSKLRYAGAVIGAIDAAVTSIDFLLNFVDECEESEFCKRLKSFLNWLELATMTADGITGIVSGIVNRKARRLAEQAGVTEADSFGTATQKVEQALGNVEDAIEPAIMIMRFADNSSVFLEIARYAEKIKEKVVKQVNLSVELIDKNLFNKNHFNLADIQEIVTLFMQYELVRGSQFVSKIADTIFIASKNNKLISKAELLKQISFYYLEIVTRRFCSGFDNLNKYIEYCNDARTIMAQRFRQSYIGQDFYEAISDIDILDRFDDFDFTTDVKYVIQGSANRKNKIGDPLLHHPNTPDNPLPTGAPRDQEFAMKMYANDYNMFMQILIAKAEQSQDFLLINEIQKYIKKGFVKSKNDELSNILQDNTFVNDVKELLLPHTNFNNIDDIDFALVKIGGPYDVGLELDFIYNIN